jgi:hypothetical protein
MAECFCGCGRTIGRFPLGIRTINKRGTMVWEQLAWATAYASDTELIRPVFLEDGNQLVALFRVVVHAEPDAEVDDAWVRQLMGGRGPEYLQSRQKTALDFLQQKSGAWMKLGRDLERTGVKDERTLPINQWLKR